MKANYPQPVGGDGRPIVERCQRCGERLNWKRIEWMELDSHTGFYHIDGFDSGEDPDRSQGWFPFGTACAKSQLKEQGQ